MKGRRRPDVKYGELPDDLQPGDYWKYLDRKTGEPMQSDNPTNLTGTCWGIVCPVQPPDAEIPVIGYLRNHTVREHEDGTISVLPGDGGSNSIQILWKGDKELYHAWIRRGVWD